MFFAFSRSGENLGENSGEIRSGEEVERNEKHWREQIGIGPPANDNWIPILGGSKWIDKENIMKRSFQNIRML